MRWLSHLLATALGWRFEGIVPDEPKMVVLGAPHTTNWDFFLFLATLHHFGLRVRYLAKRSLFRWPFGWFFRATGGVPVDRRQPGGVVAQVEQALARRDGAARERERLAALAAERRHALARARTALALGATDRVDTLGAELEWLRAERAQDDAESAWRQALVDLEAAVQPIQEAPGRVGQRDRAVAREDLLPLPADRVEESERPLLAVEPRVRPLDDDRQAE